MKNSIFVSFILIFSIFSSAFAQYGSEKKFGLEVSTFYGAAGFSSSIVNDVTAIDVNSQFQLNGIYYLIHSFGIGSGIGYAKYSVISKLANYYDEDNSAIDANGASFSYRVSASGITENQEITTFELPLFVTYRKSLSGDSGSKYRKKQNSFLLYVNSGVKFSIPLNSSYQCTQGYLRTTGFYDDTQATISYNPNLGFGTIDPISFAGKLPTIYTTSFFIDLGLSIPIRKINFLLGFYAATGITSVMKSNENQLVKYDSGYQSIASVKGTTTLSQSGIKVGLGF